MEVNQGYNINRTWADRLSSTCKSDTTASCRHNDNYQIWNQPMRWQITPISNRILPVYFKSRTLSKKFTSNLAVRLGILIWNWILWRHYPAILVAEFISMINCIDILFRTYAYDPFYLSIYQRGSFFCCIILIQVENPMKFKRPK